jgi:hypothetical protein
MLHIDQPAIRKVKRTAVEAVINLSEPMDAKGFTWSINRAIEQLAAEGAKRENDDAFYARIDGDELVLYFEKKSST